MIIPVAPAFWPTEWPASGPSIRAAAHAGLWAALTHTPSHPARGGDLLVGSCRGPDAGPGCRVVPRTLQSWSSWAPAQSPPGEQGEGPSEGQPCMPQGDTQLGLRAQSPGGSEARPGPSSVELLWLPFLSSLEEEHSLVSADEAPMQPDSSRVLPFLLAFILFSHGSSQGHGCMVVVLIITFINISEILRFAPRQNTHEAEQHSAGRSRWSWWLLHGARTRL